MLGRVSARAEELKQRGVNPFDALIAASLEAGDSAEQVARRFGVTRQAVHAAARRAQKRAEVLR